MSPLKGNLSGPTVALRADMDALPLKEETRKSYSSRNDRVMHACGHDGHMANLFGAALVLSSLRSHLNGQVKFIFPPAEEVNGAGASVMCQEGCLENPMVDVIFGLHSWPELPKGHIGIKSGSFMAGTSTLKIKVMGTGCHAATPYKGADQILTASRIVEAFQGASRVTSPSDPITLSITRIWGGTSDNILPSEVEMVGTLRTLTIESRERACEWIRRIVEGTAKTQGAAATVEFIHGYPPTVNDNKATAFLERVAMTVLPEESVHRLIVPTMVAEDFAFYLEKIPGSYFFLGMSDEGPEAYPALHSPKYDFNDKALPIGIKLFVSAALDFSATAQGQKEERPNLP